MAFVTSKSWGKKMSKPSPTRVPLTYTANLPATAPKCKMTRCPVQLPGTATSLSIHAAGNFSHSFGYDGKVQKSPPCSLSSIEKVFTFQGDGILIGTLSQSPGSDATAPGTSVF